MVDKELIERNDRIAKRSMKDSIFISAFKDKKNIIELYKDLHSEESDVKEDDINIVTWSISDKVETCSMFTKEASSEGPWNDDVIKPWGKIVKDWVLGK